MCDRSLVDKFLKNVRGRWDELGVGAKKLPPAWATQHQKIGKELKATVAAIQTTKGPVPFAKLKKLRELRQKGEALVKKKGFFGRKK